MTQLPTRARLVRGTRLLNPFTGTYYRYGGRWVGVRSWTGDGRIIVYMGVTRNPDVWARTYFLVSPESIGLVSPPEPVQESLFP